MVAMPKDQVEIKFGPARFDSPKAVRRAIEDTAAETEQNTINNIVNNPNIDLGGGAGTRGGVSVDSYDPVTGTGTGTDADGTTYDFDNGTTVFLAPGDVVFLLEDEQGDWTAVGVTERSGEVTPVDQPIAVVSTNFPLDVGSKTFPIRPDGYSGSSQPWLFNGLSTTAYDLAGQLALGTDAIIGNNTDISATSVNAFVRSSAANLSLFVPTNQSAGQYFIQPGGRLVTVSNAGVTMSYRLPGALSWTTPTIAGTVYWVHDFETGAVWGISTSSGSPAVHTVWRFLTTDAVPVNVGTLGLPNANTTAIHPWIAAGNGYLTASIQTGATRTYCVKLSSDASSFTQLGTYSTASWNPSGTTNSYAVPRLQVDQAGSTTYTVSVGGTVNLRVLRQDLIIANFNTGIPLSFAGESHKHLASGLVAIVAPVATTVFGDVNIGRNTAILATYNYSTTSYQYYNIASYGTATLGSLDWSAIQEVSAGTVRYSFAGNSSATPNSVIELSGL